MELSDDEEIPDTNYISNETIFKKPERKFMKYKPRKSIEIERELSRSETEYVTSVQVFDDYQNTNSNMNSGSSVSHLSQDSSISLVKSLDISGVDHLDNTIDSPRDHCTQFTSIHLPQVINNNNFEDVLSSLTMAKLGEKSILMCPQEHCRGSMDCKENSILVCRKCRQSKNLKEDHIDSKMELDESLINFGKNFKKPEFKVDLTVFDKFQNQPTFGDVFQKIKDTRLAVRSRREGPFYEWIDEVKLKLKEMSNNCNFVELSRLAFNNFKYNLIEYG